MKKGYNSKLHQRLRCQDLFIRTEDVETFISAPPWLIEFVDDDPLTTLRIILFVAWNRKW